MTTKEILKYPGRMFKLYMMPERRYPVWAIVRNSESTLAFDWDNEEVKFSYPPSAWGIMDPEWIEANNENYHELIDQIFSMISVYKVKA